jgi:uncharacterized protein (TIRG00374 family)
MKKVAFTITGWIITIILLGSLLAKLDLHAIWADLLRASWPYLIAAASLNMVVIALKTMRWKWLMKPAQSSGYASLFKATMIGLAGNNVLPARGGDWLKIYLLGKWEGANRAMLASITGLDKLFEALSILVLFGILSFHSTFPEWVQRGTLIISIVTAVSLAICILLMQHHKRQIAVNSNSAGRISKLASNLGSGMLVLARKRMIVLTLGLSIIVCLLQIGTIWLCQMAFGAHLDVWVPALIFVAINLAIIVPSAPSGVGPFEVACVLAYAWIGMNAETAFSIALCYHAVQFIPVTAIGAVMYLRTTGRRERIEVTQATPATRETPAT